MSNTLHYITLHYITLHYITLHYITLHESNLVRPARHIWTPLRVLGLEMWAAALGCVLLSILFIRFIRSAFRLPQISMAGIKIFGALFGQSKF